MNPIAKMLTSVVQSSAKSLMSSGIKKTVGNFIKKHMQKSPETIEKEIVERLGYSTAYYKLDKNQGITFRPSPVFMLEWIMNSPEMKGKLIKDEEAGTLYFEQDPLLAGKKVEIIQAFIKATGAQSPALPSYFDGAVKLMDVSDFTSSKFKKHFGGWKEGTPSVIDVFLQGCFGSALESDPNYARMVFKHWIVGAANRAMNPGSTLDGVFVLQGPTGIGKTQFFRKSLGAPFDKRTGEVYCDVKDPQKVVESLLGKTVACLDEMSVMEHSNNVEVLKQLLTSQWIDTRLPYRRDPQRFALRCALGGTSNKTQFITDPSLSRRLWVVKLNNSKRMDFDYLLAQRDNLWSEAAFLAKQGYSAILTPEEQKAVEDENKQFML